MLHAARPLHCTPHMLGAQKLALGTRKLFQARHRDGSTWASPRGGTAGGVVLSPHGEGGHQVGAPPVGCVRGSHACQTILISWGAGVRPCPRCWPKFCPKKFYGIWEGGGGQKALGSYVTTWEALVEVWLTT